MSSTSNNTSSDSDSDDMMDDMSIVWSKNALTDVGVTAAPPKKVEDTQFVNDIVITDDDPPDPLLYIAEQLDLMGARIRVHIAELIHRAELEALALKSSCKRGRKRKRKVKAQ